jgi:hypothetical protein
MGAPEPNSESRLHGLRHGVRVVSVPLWRLRRDAWDVFAEACGASFHCCSAVLRLRRLVGRVMALQFFVAHTDGRSEKIGQCGIAIVGARRIFLDSLLVKPGWSALWQDCFAAAVEKAGSGDYRYGSNWSIETDLPAKILAVPGIASMRTDDGYLDVIDFRQWPSFDAYLQSVSSNIRRDVVRIERLSDRVLIEHRQGLAVLLVIHHLAALRRTVLPRYGKRTSAAAEYMRHVLKVLLFRRYARTTLARYHGKVHAIFYGTAFGPTLHYNSGATRRDINGFGAFLFVHVLRDWYERHPDGRVVLGLDTTKASEHASHFRRKLRADRLSAGTLEFKFSTTDEIDDA